MTNPDATQRIRIAIEKVEESEKKAEELEDKAEQLRRSISAPNKQAIEDLVNNLSTPPPPLPVDDESENE